MPAVLVHGVPETPAIWEPLIEHLGRSDVVTLQLPGFGCPRPDGFSATKEEYVDWLIGELERLAPDGPIDLVGHDWGAGFTVRLVSLRADLVRSWVADAAGLGDVEFEWHEFAKIWQTPDEGEQFFATQLAATREQRAGIFEAYGVPPEQALRMEGLDATMAACILDLYRSAVDVGKEWAPDFVDIPKPGLVLIASEDPFLAVAQAKSAAARVGARVAPLDGVGHWWMLQDPVRSAAALREFWSSVS